MNKLMICCSLLVIASFRGLGGAKSPCLADNPSPAEARLLSDLQYLASDDLQGRAAETPGLMLGAEYIARRFEQLGLQTNLFDGKPYQEFSLDGSWEADPGQNILEILSPGGSSAKLALGIDFQPQTLGRNGDFEAELVFAGYGITSKEEVLYDDYDGIDVQGKVVIVLRKEPQANDPKSPFDGADPSQHALFTTKEINAAKHGAAALLLVNDSASDASNPDALMPMQSGGGLIKDQIPTLFLKRSLLKEWLKKYGKSLEEIEAAIDHDLQPQSFPFKDLRVKGSVSISRKKLRSVNVLGLLPGRGELADQYVIIGAHFDHVGMGGAGSLAPGTIAVHNGADDNASGTVSLLECAKRLVEIDDQRESKPRRSILFIAFSGEERGLLGSQYYVNHPRYDLEKTVAMLNMDMVGRLTDNQLTVYGTGTAMEFDGLLDRINERLAFQIERLPEGMGPSDHQSFFMKDIPVLHFFTGLHDDYHRPSDDFDKINLSGMDRIAEMVTEIAESLATRTDRLNFVKVKGRANPQGSQRRSIRLGVRLDGTTVDRVLPNSLAQKAGIREGDRLIKVIDIDIANRTDLESAMRKIKRGEEITIEVERGSEKVALKVVVTE